MVNGQLSTDDGEQPSASSLTIDNSPLTIDHLLPLLLRHIDGCPRHLSIHSGGMLITGAPLDAIVPLEPATMPGRFVCQWDKESVEDAGLIKIDLLALRTLGLVSEALGYLADDRRAPCPTWTRCRSTTRPSTACCTRRRHHRRLPGGEPRPAADVAAPQADLLRGHRRRGGHRAARPDPGRRGASLPAPARRRGAGELSASQPGAGAARDAGRAALPGAGDPGGGGRGRFCAGRGRHAAPRALAQPLAGGDGGHARPLCARARRRRASTTPTAEAIFAQLAGFAGYGFCKSHAASFALIAYQTLWLKRYHAPAFYCALLNQQPMGFYPPEVIVGDARRHGVDTLPPEINRSDWRYTLERLDERSAGRCARGCTPSPSLGEQAWARIEAARAERPFADLDDFCRRTRLPRDVVTNLIRAGALDAFGERRRSALAAGRPRLPARRVRSGYGATSPPTCPSLDAIGADGVGIRTDGPVAASGR